MSTRAPLAVVAGAMILFSACWTPSAMERCRDLVAKRSSESAVPICEGVFGRTGDSGAALAVARAKLDLGRHEDALIWTARVGEGPDHRIALDLAAGAHLQLGHRGEAERDYRAALALHREAGDDGRAAAAAYGLYRLAWSSSRYRDAFDYVEEALAHSRRAQNVAMVRLATEGRFSVLYEIGDLEGAARALEAAEDVAPARSPLELGRLLNHRGAIQFDKGRPRLARHYYSEALAAAGAAADARFLRSLHLNLVEASLALGDVDGAKRSLGVANRNPGTGPMPVSLRYWNGRVELESGRPREARARFEQALAQGPTPEWRWRLEHEAGRASHAAADDVQAEAHYRQAIECVEEMRTALAVDEMKSWLLDRKRRPFEALFGLYAPRRERQDAALAVYEQARERNLVDAFVSSAQVDLGPGGTTDATDRVRAMQVLLPALAGTRDGAASAPNRLRALRQRRHVLAYFETDTDVWLIVLASGQTRIRRLGAPTPRLSEMVEAFVSDPDDAAVAARLGGLLLPDDALPEAADPIVIVADGSIARVPFAALLSGGHRVVETHPIAYARSLAAIAGPETPQPKEVTSPPQLLGDPSGDLPEAAREVADLASRLAVRARTGREANRAALRDAVNASLLHVATHTGEGATGPWLQLADGRVGPAEIVSARLAPRLVVLATCASAAPRGRGLWGSLAAAFHVAGAGSVVASLWSVGDAPAREFVGRFYREGGADHPAVALARTQRAFIREGRPTSSWAPFVVIGLGDREGS